VQVWSAIHSENWRHRKAAADAVFNYLKMPLPDRYKKPKEKKKLFLAACEFA